ncbi:MAG: sulfur carrier protein ThiS [Candidatus Delongbacteria bacterium]|jgi:sulfur carrier protein|nr:sulfur carrier protein ThiS [Candidatus Delongbacteria bacterium]
MDQIKVNENIVEWHNNLTISEILKIMKYTFPMLVIKVDGQLIKRDQYKTYIVPNNSDVKVIHLMSGG